MISTELYGDILRKHSKSPLNYGVAEQFDVSYNEKSPLCGDTVTFYLTLNDSYQIDSVSFTGTGCAICLASASILSELVKKKSIADFEMFFESFNRLFSEPLIEENSAKLLGDLVIFSSLKEFPARQKCALLPWQTLIKAIESYKNIESIKP